MIRSNSELVFAYYHNLSRRQQAIYRQSDTVHNVSLVDLSGLRRHVTDLTRHLEAARAGLLQRSCQRLCDDLLAQLACPGLLIRIAGSRPANDYEELYGLYEPREGRPARITLWMRTAKRRQIVAFRTFLRTLLHELCHHLDYEYFSWEESFHTEGFYRRESDLFNQLVNG